MINAMEYKGLIAKINFSSEDDVFIGAVQGVSFTILFEGRSVEELRRAFKKSVDDYLELCKRMNREPESSYKGNLNVSIPPQLHRQAARFALAQGGDLNDFVTEAIEAKIAEAAENLIKHQPATVR